MTSIGEDRMDLDGRRPPARRESESEERRRSLTSSLSEGTSKFFTSMIAKKNGLLSDLSSKIETTFMKPGAGTSSSASSASSSPPSSPPVTPRFSPQTPGAGGGGQGGGKGVKERENAAARRSYAARGGGSSSATRAHSSSGYSEASSSEDHVVLNGVNISFDEPLYSARDSPPPARPSSSSFSSSSSTTTASTSSPASAMGPDRRQAGGPAPRSGSAERPQGGGAERSRPPPAGRSMSMVDGNRDRGRPDPIRQASRQSSMGSRQSSMGSRQGSVEKPPRPDKPPQIKPRKTLPDTPGGPSSPKPTSSPRGQQGPSGPTPNPPASGAAAASAPPRWGPEGAQQPPVPPRGVRSEAPRPTPAGSSRSGSESESLGGRNSPKVGAPPKEERAESPSEGGNTSPTGGPRRAPKFTTTKRRSSTVDELLFDDYVEPDSQTLPDAAFDPEKPPEDLMSFEPTHERKKISPYPGSPDSSDGGMRDHRNFASGSVDSSDVEFGGTQLRRSGSQASDKSWSSTYSIDSQPDDLTLECMSFMKTFVDKVFHNNDEISQTEKAKFGELCQYAPGRLWFSRYVNSQRSNKRVDETVFFHLMQYFAVCLFECNEAEDFSPAKTLMNMCFTFYHETVLPGGVVGKNFLYSLLRDQPIWQSLRFWNAAFFDAVQCERAHRPMPTSHDGNDDQTDDRHFQENITFGQLGTFTCNMRAFGLSKELCLEFLRKQAVIANLSQEQVALLRENVEKLKEH